MKDVTPEDLMHIVQNPELMGVDCDKHRFYIGSINGKKAIVYGEMTTKYTCEIICASWLQTEEEIKREHEVSSAWDLEMPKGEQP